MSPASTRLSLGFSCIGHAFMHVLSALYLTVVLGTGAWTRATYWNLSKAGPATSHKVVGAGKLRRPHGTYALLIG